MRAKRTGRDVAAYLQRTYNDRQYVNVPLPLDYGNGYVTMTLPVDLSSREAERIRGMLKAWPVAAPVRSNKETDANA